MASLDGRQMKDFVDVLQHAFNPGGFDRCLLGELNKKRQNISTQLDYTSVLWDVVENANRYEWWTDLLDAARRCNPKNTKLAEFERSLLSMRSREKLIDAMSNPASSNLQEEIRETNRPGAPEEGQSPLAFAVLSYVMDKESNFALLKDNHYKKIQPPGRTIRSNEYPHVAARLCASEELSLPMEELIQLPPFRQDIYESVRVVQAPYQVQVENNPHNPHRNARVHYDFVRWSNGLVQPS